MDKSPENVLKRKFFKSQRSYLKITVCLLKAEFLKAE
jgi:hypothetical protein